MIQMIIHPVALPLRHVFRTSQGATSLQRNLIVELRDGDLRGFGESATTSYYKTPIEQTLQDLESIRSLVEREPWSDPTQLWDKLSGPLAKNRFALCGVDEAAHDLWGKKNGKPVYEMWGLRTDLVPPSDYTIGLDTIEKMVEKMKEFPGWPIYKIKLGTHEDLKIVQELRQHTQAIFRVDANVGWNAEETIRNSRELAQLGVEFIEQPLPAEDWDGMKRVFQESVLPVIADESCIVEEDVERCQGYFHGINVKLTKCGGMTPGRRMIQRARALGMKVMVGCMVESSVGISAIGQLAPLLDYVDMDGSILIAEDVADGVKLDKGQLVFPPTPGNGITPHHSLGER